MGHCMADSGDHVVAVGDLWVLAGRGGGGRAVLEVHHLQDQGGRADVHGEAKELPSPWPQALATSVDHPVGFPAHEWFQRGFGPEPLGDDGVVAEVLDEDAQLPLWPHHPCLAGQALVGPKREPALGSSLFVQAFSAFFDPDHTPAASPLRSTLRGDDHAGPGCAVEDRALEEGGAIACLPVLGEEDPAHSRAPSFPEESDAGPSDAPL